MALQLLTLDGVGLKRSRLFPPFLDLLGASHSRACIAKKKGVSSSRLLWEDLGVEGGEVGRGRGKKFFINVL